MNKLKYFLALLASLCVLGFGAPVALALEQPEYGGRSTDYHPPTRNPQGSSPTGLQPTGTGSIQAGGSGVNPQALPRTGELKVFTSPDKGAATTAPEVSGPNARGMQLLIWVIGGTLTLAAVIYIVFKPDAKPEDKKSAAPEVPADQPLPIVATPSKAKKTSKKKPAKKKKSGRR